jgi:hypothetical protein
MYIQVNLSFGLFLPAGKFFLVYGTKLPSMVLAASIFSKTIGSLALLLSNFVHVQGCFLYELQ